MDSARLLPNSSIVSDAPLRIYTGIAGQIGDIVILMTYAEYEDHEVENGHVPTVVLVDQQNRIREDGV